MLVDTHTHLYLPEFGVESSDTVRRAIDSGVGKMIFPNVDLGTIAPMRELHSLFPVNTYMAMGLHPTEVDMNFEEALATVEKEVERNLADYVAIGEIGIDLYWDKTYAREQLEVFSRQVDLAVKHSLPIIIHCREGLNEVLEVLKDKQELPRGVFHSFGGTQEDVEAIRATGDFYFGINGIVTFKNSKLKNVIPEIGLDRIVLETDSPYLAPVPYRGKRNESAYIINTARAVAEACGKPIDNIISKTTQNAYDLFSLG